MSGIIVGTDTRVAIVMRAGDAAATRVSQGGRIDGWIVAEIRPREIVLRRDDRTVTVKLPPAR